MLYSLLKDKRHPFSLAAHDDGGGGMNGSESHTLVAYFLSGYGVAVVKVKVEAKAYVRVQVQV